MKTKATVYHASKHLNMDSLQEESDMCPFCGTQIFIRQFHLQQDPDIYLLRCNNCYATFASRMPNDNALNEYYSHYYDSDSEKKVTIGNSNRIANHIFRKAIPYFKVRDNISILDFGGGDGSISIGLAEELHKTGQAKSVDITIVEYDNYCKTTEPWINLHYEFPLSNLKDKKFDIIIASAILEHLPKPINEILLLFDMLREDGMLYCRTPYVLPLIKQLSKFGKKIDFTYPGHLHDLGPAFYNHLLNWLPINGKFRLIRSRPSIVETSFKKYFIRTLIAYTFKSLWYITGGHFQLVGGWEVIFLRSK